MRSACRGKEYPPARLVICQSCGWTYRGASITYDALGNPLSYYNGASFTFTWKGRQLESVYRYETTTYAYNADGIRTGKTVGTSAVEYVLDGTKILAEQNGTHSIRYYYDPQGAPVGMNFDGTVYLYEKNLQGDVIGIYTTSGTKIATYVYDAWGKLVSSSYTSGYYDQYYYNPFRYRGYYYDNETGFYYLQSRYYDPTTGRFLNADGYINANGDLQGFNMYAYCSNNPVVCADYTGEDAVVLLDDELPTHVGALIQDENGTWYHFYWGTTGFFRRIWCFLSIDVNPTTWLLKYEGEISLQKINKSKQFSGNYEEMLYFQGDFSTCIDVAKSIDRKYNLYSFNCSQATMYILSQANISYSYIFAYARIFTIPFNAFTALKEHKAIQTNIYIYRTRGKNGKTQAQIDMLR